MITKMSSAGTTFIADAITWASNGLPPISCRALGRFDLSLVPLPAAMITMANRLFVGLPDMDHLGGPCCNGDGSRTALRKFSKAQQLLTKAFGGVAHVVFFFEKVPGNAFHSKRLDCRGAHLDLLC